MSEDLAGSDINIIFLFSTDGHLVELESEVEQMCQKIPDRLLTKSIKASL